MEKDAYSEICKGLKLCPRLVPTPLWSYSLANLVRIEPKFIDAIKEGYSKVIEEARNWWFSLNRKGKCKACGEFIEKGEIDEDWFYYIKDSSGIAYLRNLRLLCRNCHLAKHQGFAGVIKKSKEALIQFAKVNKLSIEEASKIISEAFNIRSNLNNLGKWSFKIEKFKGLKNREIEELLEFMYNGKYIIDSWISYIYPKYYQEVEPRINEETLNILKSVALSSNASIQDLMVTLLNLINNTLTEHKIKVLKKEFKQYMNLILKPGAFRYSHYYPNVRELQDLIKNIMQHREVSIRYIPAILKGKWFFFVPSYDCPTLFVEIIYRLKEEKIAYSGKIPALRESYREDKLPVMFDVPSVFALNTLIRVAEIIKEGLEVKNLARKIYFKPDVFMEKEIYSKKELKPYIFIY